LRTVRGTLAAAVHTGRWSPDNLIKTLRGHEPDNVAFWADVGEPRDWRRSGEAENVNAAILELRLTVERYLADVAAQAEHPSDPDEVERAAEERLLTVPMTEVPETVRRRDVLVLVHGGRRLAPVFQFDTTGEVIPAAVEVNDILDAHDDPWGVASWWLTPHATLKAIPADAMRAGKHEEVVAAAHAAGQLV
jgi:hypothetical protein